jgi:hypothetical protein
MHGVQGSKNRTLLVFILLLTAQLCLFLFVTLRPFWVTPKGRVYIGLTGDTLAVNLIRQSKNNGLEVMNAFTTKPAIPTLGNLLYVLTGKIAYITNIDPVLMYQMTRIIGGMAIFGATYWLITLLLPDSLHLVALLFTLLVESGPLISDLISKPLGTWAPAWITQTILMRNFGPPTFVWAQVFTLTLFSFLLLSTRKPRAIYIPYIFLSAFMLTAISPSSAVTLVVCLLIPWLLYALATRKLQPTLPPISLTLIVITASALWIHTANADRSLWNLLVSGEHSWLPRGPILISFLQAFSLHIPPILALMLCIPEYWRRSTQTTRQTIMLMTSWTILPILLYAASAVDLISIPPGWTNWRVAPVALGILAALGIAAIQKAIKPLRFSVVCITISLAALLGFSLLTTYSYTVEAMNVQDTPDPSAYPTLGVWQSILTLASAPAGVGLLSLPIIGNSIPAYTPVRVFLGTSDGTSDWTERYTIARTFYEGTMNREEATQFLKQNNISYVFYGPEEKSLTRTTMFYPGILGSVFQNADVAIYSVR